MRVQDQSEKGVKMSLRRLEGRKALVTGGLRGIGRGIAEALAADGAVTIIADLDAEDSREAKDALAAIEGAAYLKLDATSEADWSRAREEIESGYGHLDILVNNVGGDLSAPIQDIPLERWRGLMALNLDSTFLGTRAFQPLLAKAGRSTPAGSSIINISSILGLVGMSGVTAYCASKGAVTLFTKSCAVEFADAGLPIRVNSVHPGMIDTPLLRKGMERQAAEAGASADVFRAGLAQATPMRRLGTPQEIGRVVAFLASDDASFMTGSEIVADGGWTAR
jgi:NAD(P)-dependent dehydrogenase (short-subunit alcohol dehydrogenase family)